MVLNSFDDQMVQKSQALGSDVLDAFFAPSIIYNLGNNWVVYHLFSGTYTTRSFAVFPAYIFSNQSGHIHNRTGTPKTVARKPETTAKN